MTDGLNNGLTEYLNREQVKFVTRMLRRYDIEVPDIEFPEKNDIEVPVTVSSP